MLKIRMQRIGRINSPAYRIVVTEHTSAPQAGKYIEKLGTYNPKSKEYNLDTDRIKHWLSVGAQPSASMHNMLISRGVISGKKINVLPAYKAPEKPAEEAAPAAAEAPTAEAPAGTPAENA